MADEATELLADPRLRERIRQRIRERVRDRLAVKVEGAPESPSAGGVGGGATTPPTPRRMGDPDAFRDFGPPPLGPKAPRRVAGQVVPPGYEQVPDEVLADFFASGGDLPFKPVSEDVLRRATTRKGPTFTGSPGQLLGPVTVPGRAVQSGIVSVMEGEPQMAPEGGLTEYFMSKTDKHPVAAGVLGVAADVATDPLAWIGLPKAAKAISEVPETMRVLRSGEALEAGQKGLAARTRLMDDLRIVTPEGEGRIVRITPTGEATVNIAGKTIETDLNTIKVASGATPPYEPVLGPSGMGGAKRGAPTTGDFIDAVDSGTLSVELAEAYVPTHPENALTSLINAIDGQMPGARGDFREALARARALAKDRIGGATRRVPTPDIAPPPPEAGVPAKTPPPSMIANAPENPSVVKLTKDFIDEVRTKKGDSAAALWMKYGKPGTIGGEDYGRAVWEYTESRNIARTVSESKANEVAKVVGHLDENSMDALVKHFVYRKPLPSGLEKEADGMRPFFDWLNTRRAERVARGLQKQEVFDEYENWLTRVLKKPIQESRIPQTGFPAKRPSLEMPHYRLDGHSLELGMSKDDVAGLLDDSMRKDWKEGGPLQVLTGNDEETLLKFAETPEGEAAAQAFMKKHGDKVDAYFKPLTQQELEELGLVKDIPSLVKQTVLKVERDLAADSFYKAVMKGKDADGLPLVVGKGEPGYVPVPDSLRYGSIRGQFVKKEVWDHLQEREAALGRMMTAIWGAADGNAEDLLATPRFGLTQWFGNATFFDPLYGNSRWNPLNRRFHNAAHSAVKEWRTSGVMPEIVQEMAVEGRVNIMAPRRTHYMISDAVDEAALANKSSREAYEAGKSMYRFAMGSPLEPRGGVRAASGAIHGALREASVPGATLPEVGLGALEGGLQNFALGRKFGQSARSAMERVQEMAEGSDLQSRIAYYLKQKEGALARGLSPEEAIRFAGEKANSMQNYTRVGGASQTLAGRGATGAPAVLSKAFLSRFFTFKEVATRGLLEQWGQGWAGKARVGLVLSLPTIMKKMGREAAIAMGLISREDADAAQADNPDAIMWPSVREDGTPTVRMTNVNGRFVTMSDLTPDLVNDMAFASPAVSAAADWSNLRAAGEDPSEAKNWFTEAPIASKRGRGLSQTAGQAALEVLQGRGSPLAPGGRMTREAVGVFKNAQRTQAGERYTPISAAGGILVGRTKEVGPKAPESKESALSGYFARRSKIDDFIDRGARDTSIPKQKQREAYKNAEDRRVGLMSDLAEEYLKRGFTPKELELDPAVKKELKRRGAID